MGKKKNKQNANIFTYVLTVIVALLGTWGSYEGGKQVEQSLSETEKIERRSEGKRFVVYDPKSFGNPKGMRPMAGSGETMEGFDAYIVEGMKPMMVQTDNLKVVEDKMYSVDFMPLPGCSELPDQPDQPTDPTPTPGKVPWGIEKVKALDAREIEDGSNATVCVVDTGTDFEHPDLKEQLVGGSGHAGSNSWRDDQGHGTHVAGTVAATLNDRDVVGVSNAKIFTAKALDSKGRGYGSWIAEAITSCVDNDADVISMSLGAPESAGPDDLIRDAVNYAHSQGVKTVCAAGNDGKGVGYPAKDCTYAVSATDSRDRLAYFSSRGPEIDVAAPGVDVLSTKMGGGVVKFSGTSMSTPHVSGACALSIAAGTDCELKGDDVGLPADQQGRGRLNVLKSL